MSPSNKPGFEALKEQVKNIKAEVNATTAEDEAKATVRAEQELATVRGTKSAEMVTWYENHQDDGMEEVVGDAGGTFQILKITSGMSNNELIDGRRAAIGKIYNSETKTESDSVEAVFCYIGKYKLPSFTDKTDLKLNYIIGGFTASDTQPFILYVHGMALQSFWDFLGKVKKAKMTCKVPLFALRVIIGVGKRRSDSFNRDVDVWDITVKADNDNVPYVEMDIFKRDQYYKTIATFKDRIGAIAGESMNEDTEMVKANDVKLHQAVQETIATDDPEWVKGK